MIIFYVGIAYRRKKELHFKKDQDHTVDKKKS